ncbi:hypothetical protein MJO29_002006 [Puccinia striiformis f. sp. tritici]|nr:hypothetical protein MJO29_002006 [Puccinia striiformis f. sp. tritici]KAI9628014.1 hypothetical protein KEM48_011861 [Puccinia striiformis f. sp. tritici PST-130]
MSESDTLNSDASGDSGNGRSDSPGLDPASDSITDSSHNADPDSSEHLDYEKDLKQDLTEAFEAITNPGTFAAWEALPTTPPAGLHVDGVGDIMLPLGEGQIRQLIDKSHQAPFGRRSETLVDLSVRKTWEINANQLHFYNPAWQGYLLDLSKRVATSLGIDGPIRLELYKMLIYETGAMFKPHTE